MKNVVFTTCTELPCRTTPNAPITICLVADTYLESSKTTIDGILLNATKICADQCGQESWRYYLEYDEDILIDPEVPLTSDDIKGIFCMDSCFIDWLNDNFEPIGP